MKGFLITILVFLIILVSASYMMTNYEQEKLNESCNDLGYEKLIKYKTEMFCVDSHGYSYKVVRSGDFYELIELKFKEVLR